MNRRIGAELPGGIQTKIANIGGNDARRAARACQLNVQQVLKYRYR